MIAKQLKYFVTGTAKIVETFNTFFSNIIKTVNTEGKKCGYYIQHRK